MVKSVFTKFLLISLVIFLVSCDLKIAGFYSDAAEVSNKIKQAFSRQFSHTSIVISCPSGLSGNQGQTFHCSGTTSDGWLLAIRILERGENAFRWEVASENKFTRRNLSTMTISLVQPPATPGKRR